MAKGKPSGNVAQETAAVPAAITKNCFADKPWLLALALILVSGLWAYHNSFTGAFVFDDGIGIVENPHVRRLWPLSEALKALPNSTPDGRPVVALSLAVNYALGGLDVRGYHVFNFVVHILAALALYGVVRRTLSGERLRAQVGSAANGLALSVALLWVVHPLQTEAVTYIVQRVESVMGLFYLVTLYCFIRSAETGASRIWSLLCVAACALGMASKEVMVSAPVLVLLYDWMFLSGSLREAVRRRWPVYLGLTATWILLGYLVATGSLLGLQAGENAKVAWWQYALTESGVILHYLRLSVWPEPLCLDYGWPIATTWPAILPPSVVVACLLAATAWACWNKLAWGFPGAWFFLILALTSSVFKLADPAFEHRMYLPLAAVVVVIVTSGYAGLTWAARHVGVSGKQRQYVTCGVVGAIVLTLGWLTARRNEDYRSDLSIWTDNIAKRPGNARVLCNLGNSQVKAGRSGEAILSLTEALRLKPDYAEAHYNLGEALLQVGKGQDAIAHYEQALRIRPEFAQAHYNLGIALVEAGRSPDAIWHYEQALRISPDYAEAHNNLGDALLRAGKVQDAIWHCEQALRLKPDFAEAHNNLGNALLQAGKVQDAIRHYEQALLLQPDLVRAHYNFGIALVEAGRSPDAIRHFEQALRLKPDFAEARRNLERLRAVQ